MAAAVGTPDGGRGARALALAGLGGVVLVWGWSYTLVHDTVAVMAAPDLTALRLTLAALVVLVARPSVVRLVDGRLLRRGALLGGLLAVALVLQAVGMERTTASVSALLSATALVGAALALGTSRRQRPSVPVLAGGALAVAGSALVLVATGSGAGPWLTLLAAVCLALHLVGLARWASEHDLWALVLVQLVVAATVSALLAAPDGISRPPDGSAWVAVVVTGVLATAAATAVQRWAQDRLEPAPAARVLVLEPVAAVVIGGLAAGFVLPWQLVVGGCAVVLACLLADGSTTRRPEGDLVIVG